MMEDNFDEMLSHNCLQNEEWVSYYQWLDYCENNVDHIHVLMVRPKIFLPHMLMIFYKNTPTCER